MLEKKFADKQIFLPKLFSISDLFIGKLCKYFSPNLKKSQKPKNLF